MRGHADTIINSNPSTITITRKTRTKSEGKLILAPPATLAAQTVRIYGKNTTEIMREGDDARFIRKRVVKMFCKYDANIKPHSNLNEDTFTSGNITYLIKDVRDITWNSLIVSKQCTLEEIEHGSGT